MTNELVLLLYILMQLFSKSFYPLTAVYFV